MFEDEKMLERVADIPTVAFLFGFLVSYAERKRKLSLRS